MKIDKRLNLVVPIERDEGTIYIHSTPISREVYERYFLVMSQAHAAIFGSGPNMISGPSIAALMLKKIATDSGAWAGTEGVENGLMNEIRRLSNVILPGANGWETLPLADALKRDLLSDGDIAEAEGIIVFFILVSAVNRRSAAASILNLATDLWGSEITLSDSTTYARSLPTLTATGTSPQAAGVVMAGSSVPR